MRRISRRCSTQSYLPFPHLWSCSFLAAPRPLQNLLLPSRGEAVRLHFQARATLPSAHSFLLFLHFVPFCNLGKTNSSISGMVEHSSHPWYTTSVFLPKNACTRYSSPRSNTSGLNSGLTFVVVYERPKPSVFSNDRIEDSNNLQEAGNFPVLERFRQAIVIRISYSRGAEGFLMVRVNCCMLCHIWFRIHWR